MDSQKIQLIVQLGQAGRLDLFLTEALNDYSRTRVQSFIKGGNVQVNGQLPKKAGQMLEVGDEVFVAIPPSEPVDILPVQMPLDILYEDSDVIVLNKPPGIVVHPSPGHREDTLVNAVLAHAPEIEGVGGKLRPGVVHRLDKNTSGVILMAKNDQTHQFLQNQFRSRAVRKLYHALVDGIPPTTEGIIEAAIARDNHHRDRMTVVPPSRGREAVTEYRVLEVFEAHALVEAHPITGRTHQIRVHLRFLGCPVAGDTVYGHKKTSIRLKRLFLHAHQLTIQLPGSPTPATFTAPLPGDLSHALNLLRRQYADD